jgi:hypothetical protein
VRSFSLALCLALAACTGRSHPQFEGSYRFTADEVFRDECALLQGKTDLFGGALVITGNEVAMTYGLFDIRLVGRYLESLEDFTVDGSANSVLLPVQGKECEVDLLTVHLEAQTDSSEAFHGVLRIASEAREAGCSCQVWATYHAVLE